MDLQTLLANAKDMFSGESNVFKDGNAGGGGTGGDPKGGTPDPDYMDLKDSKNLKSGKFKKEHIQNIIKAAKATGVDPNQLLALTWQESNLGGTKQQIEEQQAKRQQIMAQGKRAGHGDIQTNLGQITGVENPDELAALSSKTGINSQYLAPALILRNKLKEAKHLGFTDPALQLQMYNGVGKLQMKPGAKYYGQSFPDGGVLDMRQNPLYGKRLLELSSDLKKNKDIQALINQKDNPLPIPTATSVATTK